MIKNHQIRMTLEHPSRLCGVHVQLEEILMGENEAILCSTQHIYLKNTSKYLVRGKSLFLPESKLLSSSKLSKILFMFLLSFYLYTVLSCRKKLSAVVQMQRHKVKQTLP